MSTLNQTSKSSRKRKTSNEPIVPGLDQALSAPPLTAKFDERDDLLSIEGVDPTTEWALNNIGIWKFSDFSSYTPETLAQKLRARTEIAITAETIAEQDWIGWAEILAAEKISSTAAKTAEEKATAPMTENSPAATSPVAKSAEKVQQSTSPVDRESNRKIPASENLTPKNKRFTPLAKAETQKRETEVPIVKSNETKGDLTLQIQSASFEPVEAQVKLNKPPIKLVRSEIHCTLSGMKTLTATMDDLSFFTQIYAVNELTGEYKLLAANSECLLPAETDYKTQLEFEVPRHGRYQLQIIAFLLSDDPKIAFYRGPVLRVVS